jgi:AraC-like DNA-binding protein
MVPFPFPISRAAWAIESAISEGRAEEAMQKLIHALRTGDDDRAMRRVAADWIERIGLPPGAAKSLRKGGKSLLEDWLQISEMATNLQGEGKTYAAAVAETAAHFGCSDRHVQKCVAEWNEATRNRWEDG